jgi:hypothetical protein
LTELPGDVVDQHANKMQKVQRKVDELKKALEGEH